MRGTRSGRWARVPSGQTIAAPPRRVMNSRRFTRQPHRSRRTNISDLAGSVEAIAAPQRGARSPGPFRGIRVTAAIPAYPFCPKSGRSANARVYEYTLAGLLLGLPFCGVFGSGCLYSPPHRGGVRFPCIVSPCSRNLDIGRRGPLMSGLAKVFQMLRPNDPKHRPRLYQLAPLGNFQRPSRIRNSDKSTQQRHQQLSR